MEPDFWLERWDADQTHWHQDDVNVHLQTCWDRIEAEAPSGDSHDPAVLVPLCGKSRDMTWLVGRGWRVVGIELSLKAAREFFSEQGLGFREQRTGERITLVGERTSIHVGDFFALRREHVGPFHAIYDRGCSVAFPHPMRHEYLHRIGELVERPTPMLLVALEYDPTTMTGPPFPVFRDELESTFVDPSRVTELARSSAPEVLGPLVDRGAKGLAEVAYHIDISPT